MIAPIRRASSDLDPSAVHAGHNGNDEQRFEIVQHGVVRDHKRGIQLAEYLQHDQWFNWYLTWAAQLPDGEDWHFGQWIEPQEVARMFGPNCPLCSEPVLGFYRNRAFAEIERVARALEGGKGTGIVPQ